MSTQSEEPSVRTKKMAGEIQRELSVILSRELDDPRVRSIGMVTVTRVMLANDHRDATVYVSFMGVVTEGPKLKAALEGLNHSARFIRTQLSKKLHVKVIPNLTFRYDAGFDHAAKVSQAMNRPQGSDEEE